jgi:hypothetical protein
MYRILQTAVNFLPHPCFIGSLHANVRPDSLGDKRTNARLRMFDILQGQRVYGVAQLQDFSIVA